MNLEEPKFEEAEQAERKKFWKRHLPLETETCFFIFFNAMDVFVTYLLLQTESFRESNQVANYFFERFGFAGMVIFKFFMVAFVAVIVQIIATRSVKKARYLLYVGNFIVLSVVVYSAVLYYYYRFGS